MKENFETALALVLVHEGGFVNHPRDPGGATMKGVTLHTFKKHFGADKTVEDLRNITQDQLAQVYRSGYWDKCHGDQLPFGVDYAVFDAAVNSGPGRAAKWLQAAVGADADGAIGDNTLDQVDAKEPASTINALCDKRLAFLQGLNTFSTFGKGWSRRVAEVRQRALGMASGLDTGNATVLPTVDFDIVKQGSTGEWVVKLQQALNITASGTFDADTEQALKAFQTEHGLDADGIAGRQTYRALGLIA